jgi:hypothetical protein
MYKYAFYRLYSWANFARTIGAPEIAALCILTVVQWWNLLLLIELVQLCLGRIILQRVPYVATIILLLTIGVMQYHLLVKGDRLNMILKEFRSETLPARRFANVILTFYIVTSYLLFLMVGWIRAHR